MRGLDIPTTDINLSSNEYFARRLTDASKDPVVRALLPRLSPKNPLVPLDERRKNPGFSEYMLRDYGLDAENSGDQQDLYHSLSQFMATQKDALTTENSVVVVDHALNAIYNNSKYRETFYSKTEFVLAGLSAAAVVTVGLLAAPLLLMPFASHFYKNWQRKDVGDIDYMHKTGGAYHDMEVAFYSAREELQNRHVREAVNYAKILENDPDLFNKAKAYLKYTYNRSDKELKLSFTAEQHAKEELKEVAQKMLAPAHEKETQNLEQSIENSKTGFANKVRRNLELARLYASIDSDVYAVAKQNQKLRCEREKAAKAQSPISGLFDITQSKELEIDEDPENDLPKIKDFTGDFDLDLGHSWTWFGLRSNVITLTQRDGVMSLNFRDIPLSEIEGNKDVEAAITNFIETLWWQEEDLPANKRSVVLTCDNDEVACVLARAALRKGYDLSNVKIKKGGSDWTIPQDIIDNARNAREAIYDIHNSSRVVRAIENMPKGQTLKDLALQYEDDPIAHHHAIIYEYEQLEKRVKILREISDASTDKSSDSRFIQAVDKLNTIPLEQSNMFSRAVYSARDSFKGTNDRYYSDISAAGCTNDEDKKTIGDAASLRASQLSTRLQKLATSYNAAKTELEHSAQKGEEMAMRGRNSGGIAT